MFVLFLVIFLTNVFGKSRLKYHHFNSYNVHVKNENSEDLELELSSESEIFRIEEEYGRENVRRSYLDSEEYQEYFRRATQPNEHDSGLELKRFEYSAVHEILANLSQTYEHCQYGVVGKSKGNRDVYYLRIGTKLDKYDDKPEFKLVANIHGDEIVGLVLAVQFAHYLCTFYPSNDRVKEMIDNMNIYVIPTMNPDGYVLRRRGNLNNVDLNRNFPDQFKASSAVPEVEAKLMMDFSKDKNIVLGAHFHGGAQVVSYPWDGNTGGLFGRGKYSASPDDVLFKYMSERYANENPQMLGNPEFPTGMTNGAFWYTLYGGIPDWEYIHRGINAVTIELSNSKQPSDAHMNEFWNANFESLMNYASGTYKLGIRGRVINSTGHPIPNAEIHVQGIDHFVKTTENGWFTRLLTPGNDYVVGVKVPWDVENYQQHWVKVENLGSQQQLEIDFVMTNISRGGIDSSSEEDDKKNEGNLMKYLIWINTVIGMSFCCCCCFYAIILYCCFFFGCAVAYTRGRKEGRGRYVGMPVDDEEGGAVGDDEEDEEESGTHSNEEEEDVVEAEIGVADVGDEEGGEV